MRNITRASVALVAAVALTGVTVTSASAAVVDTTETTVTVAGGELSIDAPATLALATSATDFTPGATITGTLAGVVVNDARASDLGWVASVAVSDFEAGTYVIPAAALTYTAVQAVNSGSATAAVTPAAPVTGSATAATVQTAVVSGNNIATWSAGLSLAVPATAIAGQYTTTVTHSVL